MDGARFDRLMREVMRAGSRRMLLGWVSVVFAGGALAKVSPARAAATSCPPGTRIDGDSCVDCLAGTFSSESNSQQCTPCPKGQHQPATGQQDCIPCGPGSFAATHGSPQCTPCAPGTAQDLPGSDECPKCPPGHFAAGHGNPVCSQCPAGTAQPNPGSEECVTCPAGSTAPPGSATCGGGAGGATVTIATCPAHKPKQCRGKKGKPNKCCKRTSVCGRRANGETFCKRKRRR